MNWPIWTFLDFLQLGLFKYRSVRFMYQYISTDIHSSINVSLQLILEKCEWKSQNKKNVDSSSATLKTIKLMS